MYEDMSSSSSHPGTPGPNLTTPGTHPNTPGLYPGTPGPHAGTPGPPSGMPPLPRCLRGLLSAGSDQWREVERIHTLRTLIQDDLETTGRATPPPVPPRPPRIRTPGASASNTGSRQGAQPSRGRPSWAGNLGAAIAHLRREMVTLRQLDISLLCQLWMLNESLQEYKQIVQEPSHELTGDSASLLSYGATSLTSIDEGDSGTSSPADDEPLYLEPRSDPCYANISTAMGWPKREHLYENMTKGRQSPR